MVEVARRKLTELRENVIARQFPSVDPNNGLLRQSMLDLLLHLRPTTKEEWLTLVPYYLRASTNSEQVGRYLQEVLDILADIDTWGHQRNEHGPNH